MRDDLLASIAALDWQIAQLKKISVRIDGHATSISLEEAYIDILLREAEAQGLSLPALLHVSMRQDRPELTFQPLYAFSHSNWRNIPKHDKAASYQAMIT